jgi:hypothetical protein
MNQSCKYWIFKKRNIILCGKPAKLQLNGDVLCSYHAKEALRELEYTTKFINPIIGETIQLFINKLCKEMNWPKKLWPKFIQK